MKRILSVVLTLMLSGCAVTQLPDNLSRAMLNQDDPSVVAAGAPAYLLMLDALILTYPENERFLLAGAQL
ncbi:TRAP transporter TatT component family protein, partial [uncultured Thalassolituus sp.]